MTLRVFMETIKDAADISGMLAEIGVSLCEAAGASVIAPDTFHSWIYGKDKKPQGKRYFKIEDKPPKYREVDSVGFIQFFKKMSPSVWTDLRNAFDYDEINDDGIIICNTENENEFYWSLLEQFCKLLRVSAPAKPALLRHILPQNQVVFGRENEIEDIDKILKLSNYAALTGMDGIGKSYTALAYAYKVIENDKYVVQYVKCEDNDKLYDAVLRLEFEGLKEDKNASGFDLRIDALKKCLQPTLIIFDNLNRQIIPMERDNLKKLVGCGQHIKFLITSRESKVLRDEKQYMVRIEPLIFDELLKIYTYHRFSDHNDHSRFIVDRKKLIKQMFERVYYHTLMIVFLAKLPLYSSLNEYDINEKLKEGLDTSSGVVCFKKGDDHIKVRIKGFFEKLFNISALAEVQKSVMRHMALIPFSGINLRMFHELTGCRESEIIRLKDSNWIMMDEESHRISLHPLTANVIFDMEETKPTIENCKEFIEKLWTKQTSDVGGRAWYDLNKIRCYVIQKLKLRLPSAPISLVTELLTEIQNEVFPAESATESLIKEYYGRADAPISVDECSKLIESIYGSEALDAVITGGISALDKYIDLHNLKMSQKINDELLEKCTESEDSGANVINLNKMFRAWMDKFSDEFDDMEDSNESYTFEDSADITALTNILLEESNGKSDFSLVFESSRSVDALRNYISKVLQSIKSQLETDGEENDDGFDAHEFAQHIMEQSKKEGAP